jgi:hypothetical protein
MSLQFSQSLARKVSACMYSSSFQQFHFDLKMCIMLCQLVRALTVVDAFINLT